MAGAGAQAVLTAAQDFYRALNAVFDGDLGPMTAVWSHADDVTYLGPVGGIQVGWDQVLAGWQAQADIKLGGEVHPVGEPRVLRGHDLAVTCNQLTGHNFDRENRRHEVAIRETNVFRQDRGVWKMAGHHSDLLPLLAA